MPLFMIRCTDRPDGRALRAETRAAHLAYLAATGGVQVKIGGPMLDEADGGPVGSLLVVEAEEIAAARGFADADPYAKAGLFSSVEVRPWRLVVGAFG